MSAATAEINTPTRPGKTVSLPVAAATKLFAGTLAATNAAGNLVPASDTAGLKVMGRVEETVDNSAGAAGDLRANIGRGVYKFNNSATAAVDPDDIGKAALVEDDNTVAETTTNSIKAGLILEVESDGVWIDTSLALAI